MKMSDIIYQICPKNPETHLFEVQCTIPDPDPKGQGLQFPNWIPGSYMIRDFVKNMVNIKAESLGKNVRMIMQDKSRWKCDPVEGPLVVSYQIFALDLAPRGAHVDSTHAFFNGSRVFIQALGFEHRPCRLEILPPKESARYRHWQVATTLPQLNVLEGNGGFGLYSAENYDQLIDYPVEIGAFERHSFEALGIPHELIISGKHQGDIPRLIQDLKTLCEWHLRFFGQPVAIDRYQFLLSVLKGGFGGLEHLYSSCLQISPQYLPMKNDASITEGYRGLLGLFSHEYFHLWNVKRLRPKAFMPYDLTRENYTRLLWVFEGITSYYDELALVRSGLIDPDSYFELLSQLINRYYDVPGRHHQTLELSSFEAWTKFYQPTENSMNASISYYNKGALVALALDLFIRRETSGKCSLDEVMLAFWKQYGLDQQPIPEEGFEECAKKISGLALSHFFDLALRSTEDLPIESLLNSMGLEIHWQCRTSVDDIGGRGSSLVSNPDILFKKPMLEIKLKVGVTNAEIVSVWSNSAAEEAGLAPYDMIIAVNHQRVDRNTLESTIANYDIDEVVKLHVFRRDELLTLDVKLRGGWLKNCIIQRSASISPTQGQGLKDWLK